MIFISSEKIQKNISQKSEQPNARHGKVKKKHLGSFHRNLLGKLFSTRTFEFECMFHAMTSKVDTYVKVMIFWWKNTCLNALQQQHWIVIYVLPISSFFCFRTVWQHDAWNEKMNGGGIFRKGKTFACFINKLNYRQNWSLKKKKTSRRERLKKVKSITFRRLIIEAHQRYFSVMNPNILWLNVNTKNPSAASNMSLSNALCCWYARGKDI